MSEYHVQEFCEGYCNGSDCCRKAVAALKAENEALSKRLEVAEGFISAVGHDRGYASYKALSGLSRNG